MASQSIHALMYGLIDYAGLFPPAGLPMDKAVEAFANHWGSTDSVALARFILPMKRLEEWAALATKHLARPAPGDDQAPPRPWRLSVLIDDNLAVELDAIEDFNRSHEVAGGSTHKHAHTAEIDTIELKVQTPDVIDEAVEHLPEDLYPFFEIPTDSDFRGFAAALAGTGFGAKLRTGGLRPEMFPSCELVAEFITAMHTAEVPFKCTAGLHHPVRATHPLSYEVNALRGTMHGFVNVFLAAAFIRHARFDVKTAAGLLAETDAGTIVFTDAGATYKGRLVTTDQIRDTRENFAICFGSCSFDEPMADLRKLGWL